MFLIKDFVLPSVKTHQLTVFVVVVVTGFIERLRPCWSRLGSDWVFLLILGIIMALISFVLDLAIDKCQTGMSNVSKVNLKPEYR